MNKELILEKVDHTILKPEASWESVKKILDEGMEAHTASACISPSRVKEAKEYVGDKLKICTVIGFPSGAVTTAVKVFETEDAVKNGADEIDMVINIGMLKDGNIDGVRDEIKAVRRVCEGKILKVIIETCLLSEEEKITMCKVVSEAGADFIKTSTGFSTQGATFDDVKLMKDNVLDGVKVKAAGGINSVSDAEKFIELGADRLGTSRLIALLK